MSLKPRDDRKNPTSQSETDRDCSSASSIMDLISNSLSYMELLFLQCRFATIGSHLLAFSGEYFGVRQRS